MERAWRGERKLSPDMGKSAGIGPTRKALGCKRAARRERLLLDGAKTCGYRSKSQSGVADQTGSVCKSWFFHLLAA